MVHVIEKNGKFHRAGPTTPVKQKCNAPMKVSSSMLKMEKQPPKRHKDVAVASKAKIP